MMCLSRFMGREAECQRGVGRVPEALPTLWLHRKPRMSSLATEAVTGNLLFAEGFVSDIL